MCSILLFSLSLFRAIPLTIFEAEAGVKKHYLRKWLKMPGMNSFDIREVSGLTVFILIEILPYILTVECSCSDGRVLDLSPKGCGLSLTGGTALCP